MKFTLESTVDGGDQETDCEVFVVEIDPQYAAALLERIATVKKIKETDKEFYKAVWWDGNGDYFKQDSDYAGDELRPTGDPQRVECCMCIVQEDSVTWKAIPKHCSYYVSTDSIHEEDLKKVLEK